MRRRHNSLKSNTELGRKLALIRWKKDKARRDAEEPGRRHAIEMARIIGEGPVVPGQYVGTLQWHGADGIVRRWSVFRGRRSGQIQIRGIGPSKTITWLLDRLRRHLATYFRTGCRS